MEYVNILRNNITRILQCSQTIIFGGEPLLYPEIIIKIVSFAKEFCVRKSLGLIFDFTTNGTLLSMEVLNTIKDYPCFFQITLDGNRMKHNKIKYSKDIPDTFSATINNIYLIQKLSLNQ